MDRRTALREGTVKRRRRTGQHHWKPFFGIALLLLALALFLGPFSPIKSAHQQDADEEPQEEELSVEELRPKPETKPEPKPEEAQQTEEKPQEPSQEAPKVSQPKGGVPAGTPVSSDSYFADAVFLGDSRTEGFKLYSGLTEGKYLYSVGASVDTVFHKATEQTAQGKVPILDALAGMPCGKVYIMLGANELGWPSEKTFQKHYGQVIDRIRGDHPDAKIVIQSILPVTQAKDAGKTYVNNERIATFNRCLQELAAEKACSYLNVAEAVMDEQGALRADWSADGVHLNAAGCHAWLDYLRSHPLPET